MVEKSDGTGEAQLDMGDKNSSATRVQPVLNELLDRAPAQWIERLCAMAAKTRPGVQVPTNIGSPIPSEVPTERSTRERKVFERVVPPPTAFLRWLLLNPERMEIPNQSFGTRSEDAMKWRKKLFSTEERAEAIAEGIRQLERVGAKGSRRTWWAFEGFTHVDCCLMTENLVLFVEGKRTETVSPATRWFKQRSQLWRNVETADEFAAGKPSAVILAVETDGDGQKALREADRSVEKSYPHLPPQRREELSRHLLGFVTWSSIVSEFGLPASCLIATMGATDALT